MITNASSVEVPGFCCVEVSMNKGKLTNGQKILETVAIRKDSPLAQFAEKLGKVEILEKETGSKSLPSHGFYCTTCKASFTSSDAYLDHCNGRLHQKNMGLCLKVERVEAVDRVKARIEMLSKKQTDNNKAVQKEDVDLKQERKVKKKLKKLEQDQQIDNTEKTEVEDLMTSVMGFKSFS
jgi:U4/U6.U5 tri-snRNP component SNU23